MSSSEPTHTPLLPTLRADLELSVAPDEEDGKPIWMLFDPVHSSFTRIDWVQFEIIKRLDRPQTMQELLTRLNQETTIREDSREIIVFLDELIKHGLTTQTLYKHSSKLTAEQERQRVGFCKWLIFHYLYFRVPILHPDKFLENTLSIFKLLSSRIMLIIYLLLSLGGVYFLTQRFSEYIHTFTNFINPKGVLIYGITIALLKLIHEFSHAYTAKYYGNRVPTIGLAFIVLWPIPYCDVTDSWRMHSRRQRLKISAAGICAELIIAGIALFIWGISKNNSPLKSITFVLSSISLIGTLLVNLNPLMRFDGYYLFSDITGIDNLQSRAFNMTRWFYRRKLLGIKLDCPEPQLSVRRKFFMIAYSICTWIYRFFLYTGIALVVYYTFPKVIGIFLFAIEIFIFLLRPLYSEVTTDYKLLRGRRLSIRSALCIIFLFCLLIWLALPFSRYSSIPAITATDEFQIIYSPRPGLIENISIERGSKITKGQQLLQIDSKELQSRLKLAQFAIRQLAGDLRQISSLPEHKDLLPQTREAYLQAKANLRSLEEEAEQNTIYADIDGTVTDLKETLKNGVAVYTGEELGKIYNLQNLSLRLYTTSEQTTYLEIGDHLEFIPNYTSYQDIRFPVEVTSIRPTREAYLKHPELASVYKGDLEVIPDRDGRLRLAKPYFEVECKFLGDTTPLRFDQPGRVNFWSRPRSYFKELGDHVYQILLRESGI